MCTSVSLGWFFGCACCFCEKFLDVGRGIGMVSVIDAEFVVGFWVFSQEGKRLCWIWPSLWIGEYQ